MPERLGYTDVRLEKPRSAAFDVRNWARGAFVSALLLLPGTNPPPEGKEPQGPGNVVHIAKRPLPRTLEEERRLRPTLTEEEYLDFLASELDTPERLNAFFTERLRYVSDTDPVSGEPNEHWQSAKETVRRTKDGCMLGDCEDYSFLAQAIVERQGKAAHVLSPPGHAVCVWVERRPDGRYDGYSLDNVGLDKNGRMEGRMNDGFEEMIDAVNSVLRKYEDQSAKDKNYSVSPYNIPVLRMRGGPIHHLDIITIYSFNPEGLRAPSLIDTDIGLIAVGITYVVYMRLRRREAKKTQETKPSPSEA